MEKLLKAVNKVDKVRKSGRHRYTTVDRGDVAPDGTKWIYKHYTIWADGFMITATIQTIDGREDEEQCKELSDKIDAIISSFSLAKSKK